MLHCITLEGVHKQYGNHPAHLNVACEGWCQVLGFGLPCTHSFRDGPPPFKKTNPWCTERIALPERGHQSAPGALTSPRENFTTSCNASLENSPDTILNMGSIHIFDKRRCWPATVLLPSFKRIHLL